MFYPLGRTHALADEVEVATSSFIAQECNVTEKYSAMGKYSDELLDVVYRRFPAAKRMLQSGFYAVQEIPRIIDKETDIIKVSHYEKSNTLKKLETNIFTDFKLICGAKLTFCKKLPKYNFFCFQPCFANNFIF